MRIGCVENMVQTFIGQNFKNGFTYKECRMVTFICIWLNFKHSMWPQTQIISIPIARCLPNSNYPLCGNVCRNKMCAENFAKSAVESCFLTEYATNTNTKPKRPLTVDRLEPAKIVF